MLKIDIHTHILPPQIPAFKKKFGYGGFIELHHQDACSANMLDDSGKLFRKVDSNCYDIKQRLKECDEMGIKVQVLSTVPVMFNYWSKPQDGLEIAQYLNDHLATVVSENPKRFIGLGTLPMQDPDLAIKELERCVKDLGLVGVQIGSHVNQWNLSSEKVFPVFAACEKLGAAVFVHPWEMMGQESMPDYWLPWLVGMPAETSRAICSMIFSGIFEKLPQLKVAFAHGGGSFPMTIGRIEHGFNSRPDLCAIHTQLSPKKFLGKFYLDSLVHDPEVLKYLIKLMGADRVALGSDYPFPLGEEKPGKLILDSGLDEKTQQQLFYKTALDWLNLKEEFFL